MRKQQFIYQYKKVDMIIFINHTTIFNISNINVVLCSTDTCEKMKYSVLKIGRP